MSFTEVTQNQFNIDEFADHKDRLNKFPLITAVIQNKQRGKIFTSDLAVFAANDFGFSIVSLARDNNFVADTFASFLRTEKSLPGYLLIYDPSENMLDYYRKSPQNYQKIRKRVQLKCLNPDLKFINKIISGLPNNLGFLEIKKCNETQLSDFNLNIGNRFWSNWDDFRKEGIGVCLLDREANRIAAVCYSACIVNNIAEIDVATLEKYRGKGLAAYATAQFIKYCIKSGITPNWDCFSNNDSSMKLAMKFNFNKVKEYYMLSFNRKREEEQ